MTGAALQAMFANPLASPDITGSSSGAALGAVAGSYWLGITRTAGARGLRRQLVLHWPLRRYSPSLVVGARPRPCCSPASQSRSRLEPATSLLLALAPSPFAFYDSFEWLMGSFVDRSLPQAAAALIPAAVACALLARRARALDMMALGR